MTGAKGVKMPRGDIGSMKAYPALYPTKPEQQNIADCLASLDELITLETQKLDTLKTHKKGLMQQLLPAEGETLPKLRFPEFRDAGEWKKKQIGKALIEQPRPIDMDEEGEYSLVTVKRRYGGVVSRGVFMGKSIKVKTQFLLQENDFLISKRQIVHCACGVVPKTLDGSIVSNEYSVLRARDGFDVLFFDYFAQQPTVSQSFLRCSIGIVIEKMLFKLNDWLKEEFFFPSLQEQKKIADCLTTLDDLITAQTQKLAAIKIHKKGLMQQLFPSPEEV
jgi:type I restriction enzyme S subunit